MKKIIKWGIKHICLIMLASIAYIITFYMKFLNLSGIYFYDGIIRLLFVMLIMCGMEIFTHKWLRLDYKDICLSICTFVLVNMLWLSLCIVSLDRSLSVFMLCYLNEYSEEGGLREEEIEIAFQDIFVEKYGMLERRFNEQIKSGNIVYNNGKYMLTSRGKWMVSIFKMVGNLYNVDKRFIVPEK